jgi:hypothetical protein
VPGHGPDDADEEGGVGACAMETAAEGRVWLRRYVSGVLGMIPCLAAVTAAPSYHPDRWGREGREVRRHLVPAGMPPVLRDVQLPASWAGDSRVSLRCRVR